MKQANIVFLIDIQNGFAKDGLTKEQGGCLYVPEGERVGAPVADLIAHMKHTVFVLSQDFHPASHISFASNHVGAAPLDDVYLRRDKEGRYGVVVKNTEGAFVQKLWPEHCVQGTDSALIVDEVMDVLPQGMQAKLRQHVMDPVLIDFDDRGNSFYVVRKGMRDDLDSYGIATENDGISKTKAPVVFRNIARAMRKKGVREANLWIGGLATNFCVEFSNADLFKECVPQLTKRGIKTGVNFLADISRGVPIPVPDGAWPDLAAAARRMAAFGTVEASSVDIIRAIALKANSNVITSAYHL